jgi:hypothetical protein
VKQILRTLGLVAERLFSIPKYLNDDGTPNANYMRESDVWRRDLAGFTLVSLSLGILAIVLVVLVWFGSARAEEMVDVRANQLVEKLDQVDFTICESQRLDPQLFAYRSTLAAEFEEITGDEFSGKPCDLLVKLYRR